MPKTETWVLPSVHQAHHGKPTGCTCGGPKGCPLRPHSEHHRLNASRQQKGKRTLGESRATRTAETSQAGGVGEDRICPAFSARTLRFLWEVV